METETTNEIWFERDGARLFAVDSGAGRPVILLHGGLATHLACRAFGGSLASRFRLITPDLRASGRSIYNGLLSWDQLADDIAALVCHLELDRVVIGGVSFGAGCAVRVALRHPQLAEALVLLHPAYGGAEHGLTAAQQSAMDSMDAAGRRAVAEGVQVLFPLFDALPPPIRDRGRAVAAGFDPASVARSTQFMASGAQPFSTTRELASIRVPVLLVPGTDPTHPASVADVYRRGLSSCTVRDVEPSGFARAIAEFARTKRA